MSDPFTDPSPPETFAPIFKPPKITTADLMRVMSKEELANACVAFHEKRHIVVVDDAMVERAARVLADSWGPQDQAIAEWTRTVAAKMIAQALTP